MPHYPMPTDPPHPRRLYSEQTERWIHSAEVSRLERDNARLRAEVADLRERLAAAHEAIARMGGRPGD